MLFSDWDLKYKKLKNSTNLLLGINLFLLILLSFSLLAHFNRKPIVVVHPIVSQQSFETESDTITKSYGSSLALSFSLLIGNWTSDNMKYIMNSFSNYIEPVYFRELQKKFLDEMNDLVEKRLSLSFTPVINYYDSATKEFVVEGIMSITTVTNQVTKVKHQYRYSFTMNGYIPRITKFVSMPINEASG